MNKKKSLWFMIALLLIGLPLVTFAITKIEDNFQRYTNINKQVQVPYLKKDGKKITILFFGYVGCEDVCTPFLTELNTLYKSDKWKSIKNKVEVVFVNLIPTMDPELPMLYASSFNKKFIGIYLDKNELRYIDKEFRLSFSKSVLDSQELEHSEYFYIIKNDKSRVLKRIYYSNTFDEEELYNYLSSLLNSK